MKQSAKNESDSQSLEKITCSRLVKVLSIVCCFTFRVRKKDSVSPSRSLRFFMGDMREMFYKSLYMVCLSYQVLAA